MKVLKKQWLTLLMLASLIVTLTLGVVFMMPAKSAKADELRPVGTEAELKVAFDAVQSGDKAEIQLTEDIALNSYLYLNSGRDITIDLNGHKLSNKTGQWVIAIAYNGKLTLVDSQGDGEITNAYQASGYSLIWNWGTLITSVNITVPEMDYRLDPYYCSGSPAIFSTNQVGNATKPSVTVLGGTITGPGQGQAIELIDADLTVEGGTFLPNPSKSDNASPPQQNLVSAKTLVLTANTASSLAEAKQALQSDLEDYASFRGSEIKVTGGDFTAFKSGFGDFVIDPKIYVGYSGGSGDSGKTADISVTLDGDSIWGKDLSSYTPNGKWMELYDPSVDVGPTLGAEKYYVVKQASEETAGATITIGSDKRYYSDFGGAWVALGKTTEDRTLTLLEDVTIEQLNFSKMSGKITLDLNGKKLTITRSASSSSGHIDFGSPQNLISLTVKDGSELGGGEIVLDTPSGGYISYNSFIHIKNNAKFTLESGTIRQTGYFAKTYEGTIYMKNKGPQAIFQLNCPADAQDVVTIKGGNIISEIYYGTEDVHGALTSSPYLVSWYVATETYELNFEEGTKYTNKTDIFKFDLAASIEAGNTSVFSWNLKDEGAGKDQWAALGETFKNLTLSPYGNHYMLSNFTEEDNFLASDGKTYGTLNEAVEGKTGSNYSITVLQDKLTIDENVTLDGITLDLDRNRNFVLTLGRDVTLTLQNGAKLLHGTLAGGVTVAGDATMEDVTVTSDVTVTGGTLTIPSGTYQGAFNFTEGKAYITGGTFMGSQAQALDEYLAPSLGLYKDINAEYQDEQPYKVKTAPNMKAQKWYKQYKESGNFQITTTDEWNYFAIIVSTGIDSFENKTVTLNVTEPAKVLDFGYKANGVSAASYGQDNGELDFFPAGNQMYRFKGTFNGNGHTITGVHVVEINAGIFGGTNGPATINDLTVENSLFEGGKGFGYFDEYNTESGWVFVGGVVAQGNLAHTSAGAAAKGIKINNVTISQKERGSIMGGGFIGQTWNDLYLEGIEVNDVKLDGSWKMGGVVGFTEASVYLIKGSVKGVESLYEDCIYYGSVMGQLVGQSLTLESTTVQSPDSYLVGGIDAGSETKDVNIKGVGTDIEAMGTADRTVHQLYGSHEAAPSVTVPTTEEETEKGGFSVNFGNEEIPNDAYKTEEGETVAAFRLENGNMGGYKTLAAALKGAKEGDTVVLNGDVTEKVEIAANVEVTLDLNGYTLTGTISVAANGSLTLENGFVTAESGNVITVAEGGTLILEVPALGEGEKTIKELKITAAEGNKAINGAYTVEKNDYVVCVRVSDNEIYLAKEHDVGTYTVEGDTITVHCKYDNVGYGTVKVVAPEDPTYGDEAIEATVEIVGFEPGETFTITYKNANGGVVTEITDAGTYTASITFQDLTASVTFTVAQKALVISDIKDEISYAGEGEPTLEVKNYTLTDLDGNVVTLDDITVTVTLQKSKYSVGKQVALITAINMTGNDNYTLAVVGNEAFIELDVSAAALTVRVNSDGSVSYEGFVGGEDESVLGGELTLEKVDNGDGTYTVTPSGLTSENYNITYVSGIVAGSTVSSESNSNNALWIALAVVGSVVLALGAVTIIVVARKKRSF